MATTTNTTNVSISVRIPNRFRAQLSQAGSLGSSAKASLLEAVDTLKKYPNRTPLPVKAVPDEPSVAVIIGVRKIDFEELEKVAKRSNLSELPLSQQCRLILTAWLDGQIANTLETVTDVPATSINNQQQTQQTPGKAVRKGDDANADDTLLQETLAQMGLKPRHEQKLLFRQTSNHLRRMDAKKVLFAEAGTGIGKTLTYLIQAGSFIQEQRIKGTPVRVCICAPSYSHISQIMSTWDKSLFPIYGFRPMALGSQKDFVSEQRLRQLVETLEGSISYSTLSETESAQRTALIASINKWMQNPVAPADFRSRAYWTMEGLCAAAPQFLDEEKTNGDKSYANEITLESRHDDNDLGWISYRNQFIHAASSDLWVMTHALLASKTKQRLVDMRRQALQNEDVAKEQKEIVGEHRKKINDAKQARTEGSSFEQAPRESLNTKLNQLYETSNDDANGEQGDLPTFDLLIVDEAHALDAAFDLVLSSRISLWSIINDVQVICSHTPSLAATLNKLRHVFENLKTSPSSGGAAGSFSNSISHSAPLHSEAISMQLILEYLKSIKEPKNKATREKCAQEYRRLTMATRALDIAMRHRDDPKGMVGSIDWSPDRSWPRLVIGRSSLESEMDYLWRHVARSTILVSGTLYESSMINSISAMRINLNVAVDLVRTMDPIHARWTIDPVTICTVANTSRPDGSKKFIRPSSNLKDYANLHQTWSEEVAHYIWSAQKDSPLLKDQGGMLVLATSFKDIEAMSECVNALMGKVNNRQPLLIHKKGVPLADLKKQYFALTRQGSRPILFACGSGWTGFDLSDENLPYAVTDLVIVNAPFGVLPDMVSKRRRGFLTTIADVYILTRQGTGRLIRHMLPSGSTRRIHWLDARIHQTESSSWGKGVRKMFSKYPKQITVTG